MITFANDKADEGLDVMFEKALMIEDDTLPSSESRASPGMPWTRRENTTPEIGV